MLLHQRAVEDGVDQALLDDVMDSDNPKLKIVEMMMERRHSSSQAEHARAQAQREELETLRVMTLHARAAAEGVDATAIDDAMEASKPKAALGQDDQ